MFRSLNIIRENALNLATVIFMLKYSVKVRHYLFCGCVAACNFAEYFNINITLARFSASSLMMVEDRNMQERYFCVF